MDIAMLIKALGGFLAIMNPFVALPMFLSLTESYSKARQHSTAVRVALYCAVMGAVIFATGTTILKFFGLDVNDFRVAGGLILLILGLGMLNGTNTAHGGTDAEHDHQKAQAAQGDVSFYPLTFPMMLGPGTITTIVAFTGQAEGVPQTVGVVVAFALVLVTLFVVLWFAPVIGKHMGQTLQTIMTRLMGMILAAIAMNMMIQGLTNLIPALRQ